MKTSKNTLTWIVGLVAAAFFILPLCTFQVRKTQVAIVATFGKYSHTPVTEGLHGKWPWPIQKVYKLDCSLNNYVGKYEECATSDDRNLVVAMFAAWQIDDPALFLESVGSTDEANRLLGALISTEKNVVIARNPLRNLVATTPVVEAGAAGAAPIEPAGFAAVEADILAKVQEMAGAKYGIKVETVAFYHLGLPETITQDVFKRMREQRALRANQIREEGRKEAELIKTKANEEGQKTIDQAEAEAITLRGEGDAAAAKYYKVFKDDAEFALFLRRLKALEATMDDKTTIVIDTDVRPFDLLRGDAMPATSAVVPPVSGAAAVKVPTIATPPGN